MHAHDNSDKQGKMELEKGVILQLRHEYYAQRLATCTTVFGNGFSHKK